MHKPSLKLFTLLSKNKTSNGLFLYNTCMQEILFSASCKVKVRNQTQFHSRLIKQYEFNFKHMHSFSTPSNVRWIGMSAQGSSISKRSEICLTQVCLAWQSSNKNAKLWIPGAAEGSKVSHNILPLNIASAFLTCFRGPMMKTWSIGEDWCYT